MRFDYQPALADVKIVKTSKQRKLLLISSSLWSIGCLIIILYLSKANSLHRLSSSTRSVENTSNVSQSITTLPVANAILPKSNFDINTDINIDIKAESNVITKPTKEVDMLKDSQNSQNSKNINVEVKPIEIKPEVNIVKPKVAWKTIKIQSGDTLTSILQRLSIPVEEIKNLNNFIKHNVAGKAIANIKTGQLMDFLFDENNNLKTIKLIILPHKSLLIDKLGANSYSIHHEEKPITKKLNFASSNIVGSFFVAAQAAGLSDNLIMEVADIFGWDIDFVMDIRPQDRFRLIYEEKFVDQEKIGTGHILVAEFINQGRVYQAIRFSDDQSRVSYYTPEGYSMNKTFLRNPVKFSRIGSKFSTSRRHPILHKLRAHKGVDYVAPSGTPVKAAGDGKVVVIGRKGGYGNIVELQHGNKYSTLYAHLSSFARNIKKDTFVKQGQIIGYVGRTGLATGDHLHYEFRVNGVHRDPLTVQLPKSMPLPSKYRAKFLAHAKQMINLLNETDGSKVGKVVDR